MGELITWRLRPSPQADPFTTGPASPNVENRHERGCWVCPALKIQFWSLAPTPPHPGHASWLAFWRGR